MKVEFDLDALYPAGSKGMAAIVGVNSSVSKAYVSIRIKTPNAVRASGCIKDKELERFAVNILKALKSKKLK